MASLKMNLQARLKVLNDQALSYLFSLCTNNKFVIFGGHHMLQQFLRIEVLSEFHLADSVYRQIQLQGSQRVEKFHCLRASVEKSKTKGYTVTLWGGSAFTLCSQLLSVVMKG